MKLFSDYQTEEKNNFNTIIRYIVNSPCVTYVLHECYNAGDGTDGVVVNHYEKYGLNNYQKLMHLEFFDQKK